MSYKVNRAGTKEMYHEGELVYACQYCDTWFRPSRRFVHKYCSESCRVMACRERKEGLYGISGGNIHSKRDSTTNLALYNQIETFRSDFSSDQRDSYRKYQSSLDDMLREMWRMNRLIQWNTFISAIAPVVGPALVNWLKNIFTSNKDNDVKDIETFIKMFNDHFGGKIDPELSKEIINAARDFVSAEEKPKG